MLDLGKKHANIFHLKKLTALTPQKWQKGFSHFFSTFIIRYIFFIVFIRFLKICLIDVKEFWRKIVFFYTLHILKKL